MAENLPDTNVGNIEYIRREDAIDAVNHALDRETILFSFVRKVAISALKGLHTADVAPVVHGRWIKYTGMGKVQWMCSECSAEEKNPKVANYCYYCGAKMRGEQE